MLCNLLDWHNADFFIPAIRTDKRTIGDASVLSESGNRKFSDCKGQSFAANGFILPDK